MRRGFVSSLFVLVVIAALIALELVSGSSKNSKPGRPAPPLPAAVLVPPRVTIAELRGRPAVINFWASWCDPCRKEAPGLERFARSLKGQARLIGVDYTDGLSAARSFVHEFGWTFPNLRDPNGVVGLRYGLSGVPTTVILDSRGRIQQTLRGPQTVPDLRRALKSVSR